MNPIRFATLSLTLLAAACGGADFQAGGEGPGDGATADAELDGAASGGSASMGGAAADGATGGAENASGGAGGRVGSGGATAAGGAGPGGASATGGASSTGGAPETGGAAGTGGASPICPPFACPVCKEDLGNCCLGPRLSYTGCGCTFLTGVPSTPVGCHQE